MLMLEAKPMHLEEFATQAMSKENSCNSTTHEPTDIERRYWQSMHLRPPLYGADIAGSLFDEGKKVRMGCDLHQAACLFAASSPSRQRDSEPDTLDPLYCTSIDCTTHIARSLFNQYSFPVSLNARGVQKYLTQYS